MKGREKGTAVNQEKLPGKQQSKQYFLPGIEALRQTSPYQSVNIIGEMYKIL